jgi:hypothetical protein
MLPDEAGNLTCATPHRILPPQKWNHTTTFRITERRYAAAEKSQRYASGTMPLSLSQ